MSDDASQPDDPAGPGKKIRVLLVDDHAVVRSPAGK